MHPFLPVGLEKNVSARGGFCVKTPRQGPFFTLF
jgi:hypothetical protein